MLVNGLRLKEQQSLYHEMAECAARLRLYGASPHADIPLTLVSYDLRFVQASADNIEQFKSHADHSKPLYKFYKGGSEVGELQGANAKELGRLISKHASKK